MNVHLIKFSDINGLRAILFNNIENIKPTPTPTPAKTINGILDARYLKPSNMITFNLRYTMCSLLATSKMVQFRRNIQC